jgi:hypothetical protein
MTGEVATKVPARVGTRSGFFVYMSAGFLAIALIAFSTTFLLPLARGTFVAPPVTYVHGTLMFAWLIFLIAQASLIRIRKCLSAPPAWLAWSFARRCRRNFWRRRIAPIDTQGVGSWRW